MKSASHTKRLVAVFSIIGLLALSSLVSADTKSKATFFWAGYDGVTEDYRADRTTIRYDAQSGLVTSVKCG